MTLDNDVRQALEAHLACAPVIESVVVVPPTT